MSKRKKAGGSTLVHEGNHEGQHRIVQLNADGTNEVGKWTEAHQIATYGKYFAISGDSPLPQGVFTTNTVAAQVLG